MAKQASLGDLTHPNPPGYPQGLDSDTAGSQHHGLSVTILLGGNPLGSLTAGDPQQSRENVFHHF